MSSEMIQAIRGMNDILPEEMPYWHFLEDVLRKMAVRYGYCEIRTPVLEKTALFKRSIGEVTDIVEKEMYTFLDRNEESLSLRPEGTASIVRAGNEHGMFYNQIQKLWYMGPMYRHERPQRGRYRQFYQFGLEVFGISGAEIDAEIILFNARVWRALGITEQVKLHLNTLGSLECRLRYREILVNYFSQYHQTLDEDSQRRLLTNPLRILDSKNPAMQNLLADVPKLINYLDKTSAVYFEKLQYILSTAGIEFIINPQLVRGLDYYTDTVFEWVTTELGAQGTISAGGRYDALVALLGGQATPAVGFALGIERIVELLKLNHEKTSFQEPADIFLIMLGDAAMTLGFNLAEQLRDVLPNLTIIANFSGGSFKNQFKKADKSGAKVALILGEDEVTQQTVGIKFLREDRTQEILLQSKLIVSLQGIFKT